MEFRAALLLLLMAVIVVVGQELKLEQCACSEDAVGFCLPRGGVLLQRFANAAPLCEAKDAPCDDGLVRVCIKAGATTTPSS